VRKKIALFHFVFIFIGIIVAKLLSYFSTKGDFCQGGEEDDKGSPSVRRELKMDSGLNPE
jgi:hypothetical protein